MYFTRATLWLCGKKSRSFFFLTTNFNFTLFLFQTRSIVFFVAGKKRLVKNLVFQFKITDHVQQFKRQFLCRHFKVRRNIFEWFFSRQISLIEEIKLEEEEKYSGTFAHILVHLGRYFFFLNFEKRHSRSSRSKLPYWKPIFAMQHLMAQNVAVSLYGTHDTIQRPLAQIERNPCNLDDMCTQPTWSECDFLSRCDKISVIWRDRQCVCRFCKQRWKRIERNNKTKIGSSSSRDSSKWHRTIFWFDPKWYCNKRVRTFV